MELKVAIAASEEAKKTSKMARGDLMDRYKLKVVKDGARGLRSRGKEAGDHGAWQEFVEMQNTHHGGHLGGKIGGEEEWGSLKRRGREGNVGPVGISPRPLLVWGPYFSPIASLAGSCTLNEEAAKAIETGVT